MGMFDSVFVGCPRCGKETELQSKAGDCYMQRFSLTDAPEKVIRDIAQYEPTTCDCGLRFRVIVQPAVRGLLVIEP